MRWGCLKAEGLPLKVPAHEKQTIHLLVETRGTGEFDGTIVLYTDAPGLIEFPLKVKGRVVKVEDKSEKSPSPEMSKAI